MGHPYREPSPPKSEPPKSDWTFWDRVKTGVLILLFGAPFFGMGFGVGRDCAGPVRSNRPHDGLVKSERACVRMCRNKIVEFRDEHYGYVCRCGDGE